MNKRVLYSLTALSAFYSFSVANAEEVSPHLPAEGFKVPEGFEVSVWATSPLFYNPTNMDIDSTGRVWVAEGRNYRTFKDTNASPRVPEGDRIMVISDTDGDGKANESHVFVQDPDLVAPLGVAVIDNQVVVSQPPSLFVYTDVDRDAVFDPEVDKKEALLTGFGGKDHDHSLHAVTVGPSGQWYFNVGNAGTHVVTDKEGWTLRVGSFYNGGAPSVTEPGPHQGNQPGLVSDDGHIYVGSAVLRVNPDGTGLRVVGHNMRNSYEETVNSYGDVFQNDNDDPPACRTTWVMEYGNMGYASSDGERRWQVDRRPGQTAAVAEWRQEDPGVIPAGDVYGMGSPTGICFYENGALGEKWEGLLLSAEAAQNVIYGYFPQPQGAGYALERFDFFRSKRAEELKKEGLSLQEDLTYFRPADVTVGPDGCIYVADWFDPGVGGHATKDEHLSGAIYRITPKGKNPRPVSLALETPEGQLEALKSPANNTRNIGFTRLKEGGEKNIALVKTLLQERSPYLQARGIWLLAQLGSEGIQEVEKVLKTAENPQIRVTCFRALRFMEHEVISLAQALATDPSPAVRREVALSLRDRPWEETGELLVTLAEQYDGKDRWYLEALGTGATGQEKALYDALLEKAGEMDATQWTPSIAGVAWRLHPEHSVKAFLKRAKGKNISLKWRKEALSAIAFIPTEEAALAMVELVENGPADTKTMAAFWLQNRSVHLWKKYVGKMKGHHKKANEIKVDKDFLAPITGENITHPTVEEVLSLKGDVEKGRVGVARCYMCHQVNQQGVDFGPPLDTWGLGRSEEAIATAIIDPNAGLAHGYEAVEAVTKEGHRVQGFTIFAGASKIIKTMGGLEVTIPNKMTKSMKPMEKSLMMSAGQLGMSAQEVADVVAFLKQNAMENSPSGASQGSPASGKSTASLSPEGAGSAAEISVPTPYSLGKDGRDMQQAPPLDWGESSGKKRILFIAGHTTHRHGFHEYRAGSILLANALNASGLPVVARVHYYEFPEDHTVLDGVDTIVFYADSGAKLRPEDHEAVDQLVKKGVNVMFMHYAVHPSKENGERYYKPWIGGYFDDALSVNPSWVAELTPKQGHPVSNGLPEPVKVFDELYWNLEMIPTSPHHYALAQATPTPENMVRYGSTKFWNEDAASKLGKPQPLLWCHDPEKGARGAGFTGGHYHCNWAIDNYRKLILNTIAWVSRVEIPSEGVPSAPVSEAQLNENLNRPEWKEKILLPSADLLTQPGGKPPKIGANGRAIDPRKK